MMCKRWIISLLTVWLAAGASAQESGTELKGFRVPEYDENGVMTSQLFGERAVMESDGQVRLTGVRMEFYRDGEVFMEVGSPYCLFNQKTGEVKSDEPVSADMEGVRVQGVGFEMDTDARKVHVLQDSRVELDDLVRENGVAVRTNSITTVTSVELFLDYTGRSVRFTETVRVDDPRMELSCDTLDIKFDEQNEVEWIKADGETCKVHFHRSEAAEMGALVKGASSEDRIVITSGTIYVDESKRTVRFEEAVHVEDVSLDLQSDQLTARFNESDEIDWIEAVGKVRILSEGREAYAGRASYSLDSDEFLLEDRPKVVDGKNMLMGEKIRFWRGKERMLCEPSARVIVYPDEKINPDLFGN
jgi:lipopolysaccharide transport protein LptA